MYDEMVFNRLHYSLSFHNVEILRCVRAVSLGPYRWLRHWRLISYRASQSTPCNVCLAIIKNYFILGHESLLILPCVDWRINEPSLSISYDILDPNSDLTICPWFEVRYQTCVLSLYASPFQRLRASKLAQIDLVWRNVTVTASLTRDTRVIDSRKWWKQRQEVLLRQQQDRNHNTSHNRLQHT